MKPFLVIKTKENAQLYDIMYKRRTQEDVRNGVLGVAWIESTKEFEWEGAENLADAVLVWTDTLLDAEGVCTWLLNRNPQNRYVVLETKSAFFRELGPINSVNITKDGVLPR